MNEIAGFCDGSCNPNDIRRDNLNNPPYLPTNHKIFHKALYMDSKNSLTTQYNSHNLYGHFESISTYNMLIKYKPNKRPFIITRSSFPGTGKYAGKWSGDNFSTWHDLHISISFLFAFNIFGIPFNGADICGFQGHTTEELCIRWHQLGSFYPFSRNHNEIFARDQEPFAFGPHLINTTRAVLLNRYSLLPYYYTLFFNHHINGGNVIKSIPFEFPEDDMDVIDFLDRQFLVGSGLLVSPVLDEKANTVYAYFPVNNVWYDYFTGFQQNTGWHTLKAPIDVIQVHIRGGFIIPRQLPALTTEKTKKKPLFFECCPR